MLLFIHVASFLITKIKLKINTYLFVRFCCHTRLFHPKLTNLYYSPVENVQNLIRFCIHSRNKHQKYLFSRVCDLGIDYCYLVMGLSIVCCVLAHLAPHYTTSKV